MLPFSLRSTMFALAVVLGCAPSLLAQQSLAAPLAAGTPTTPADSLAWTPQGLSELGRQASSHTDFSFDRSVLGLVGNLSTLDAPTRQAIARLNGIALHLYRFPGHDAYSAASLESIRRQYDELGWKHFATSHPEPGLSGEPSGHTDVWLNMHGINIAGATILLAGPSSVDLIAVSGDLSTLDLLHLRGHFGIPRFPEDALPH